MIVKVKTFSGETLYLPEEDYLEEVMYSDSTNETKKSSGIGGATVGAGLGLATGAATGLGLVSTSKKFRQAKSLIDKVDIGPNAKITRNNWWGTSVQGSPRNFDRLRKISHVKNGIVRRGLLGGAAIGAATLGTAGYLYSRNKNKN